MIGGQCGRQAVLATIVTILWGGMFSYAAQEPLSRLSESFSVSHWGRDDGMPEVAVVAVEQSADGFIWCLTPNHLLFFNGLRFEDWGQLDSGTVNEPYPVLFRGWSVDDFGKPWIFGQRGIMQRTTNGWHRRNLATSGGILGMFRGSAKNFWVVTEYGGIRRIEDNLVESVAPLPSGLQRITTAATNADGSLLLGSQFGLFRFQDNAYAPVTEAGLTNLTEISCLRRGRSNDWWICCREGLVHEADGVIHSVSLPFPPSVVTSLIEDATGAVWIGTKQGLYCYSGGKWSLMNARDFASPVNVLCLGLDRQNYIWVGTSEGLFCLRPKLVKVLFSNPRHGLQTITSLAITDRTNLWVGSLSDGLLKVQGTELKPANFSMLSAGVMISALQPSRDGGLWVGTLGDQLFRVNGEAETQILQVEKSPLRAREITSILETDTNQLWVGTWEGLFRMTNALKQGKTTFQLEPVSMRTSESHGLSPIANRVEALVAERDGSVWIGYDGLWVLRRDLDSSKGVYGYGWGLPGPYVRTFYRDRNSRLWSGTSDGLGLLSTVEWQQVLEQNNLFAENLDQRTHDRSRWQHFGKKSLWERMLISQGLAEADIRQIIEDDHGRFWLGTRKGIQVFAREDLEAVMEGRKPNAEGRLIGLEEGMESEECTLNSSPGVIRDSAGLLYFATTDGLVMADPARFTPLTNLAPVYIQQVLAGDQLIFKREGDSPVSLAQNPLQTSRPQIISMPKGFRDVKFTFATPVYDAPARMRFRWRLDGVDNDWSAASDERAAKYPRLAPGDYTFYVMAGGHGSWRETESPFRFRIRPYFYERAGVQAVAGLGLTAAVAFAVWRLERQRGRRKMQRLEREQALERERARIARDLHDELGVGLTEIGLLGDLAGAQTVPAESKTGLAGEISGRARGLVAALDEIVWAMNPANDNSLSLGDYFSRFAETLLQRAGLRCEFHVETVSPEIKISAEMRHQLFLAFKETLNNIITHARASAVAIHIGVEHEQLVIRVTDDGSGFEHTSGQGSPDGLRGMNERLAQIGGRCEIESSPGRGTAVRFTLPNRKKPHS